MNIEKFWIEAVKVTGPVGVVGFLFWFALNKIFQQEVLALFGTEQKFIIVLILICGLFVVFLAAIFTFNQEKEDAVKERKVTINKSKLKGDIVMGDKHLNDSQCDE
jgi:hypothetical protein